MTTSRTAAFGTTPFRTAGQHALRALVSILAVFAATAFFTVFGEEKGEDELRKGLAAFDTKDYESAVEFFRASAEKGNSDAMMLLSICMEEGKGVPADKEGYLVWVKKAADAGNLTSMVGWGSMKLKSPDTEKEGLEYLKKAADRGSVFGQVVLGIYYTEHSETAKGVEYLRKAADRPLPKEKTIEDYLIDTSDIPFDELKDLNLTVESSFIICAQIILGATCVQGGNDFKQDFAEAKKWLGKARDNGFASAGEMIRKIEQMEKAEKETESVSKVVKPGAGREELRKGFAAYDRKDYKAAAELFRAGANKGNSDAMVMYSYCLSEGIGVEKGASDPWIKKALEAGNLTAAALYGAALTKNPNPATVKDGFALLQKAADQGDIIGCVSLGSLLMMEDGETDKAAGYLKKVATMPLTGSSAEKTLLDYIGDRIFPQDIREIKSMNSTDKAILMCQFLLGGVYLREGDQPEAKKWFRMASDNGLPAATRIVKQFEQHEKTQKESNR